MNGQLKTIRYYPYFADSFKRVKSLLYDGYYSAADEYKQLSHSQMKDLQTATDLDALYDVIGEDFYVIVPAPSMVGSESSLPCPTKLEGTRITLVRARYGLLLHK